MRSHDVLCKVESELLVASLNMQTDHPAMFVWQPVFPRHFMNSAIPILHSTQA